MSVSVSEVCISIIFLLQVSDSYKVRRWYDLQWHNFYSRFLENQSAGPEVERGHTDKRGEIISVVFFLFFFFFCGRKVVQQ
jgi:hypothetical protein